MTPRFTWNGLRFVGAYRSAGATCWESEAQGDYGRPLWKVRQHETGGVWYARLRLGGHRFAGEGTTAAKALSAAKEEARRVSAALLDAGCGGW